MNLSERMNFHKVPGVSIATIRKGELESVETYGVLEAKLNRKVSEESYFNSCSISKFATALLTLRLVDEGILELDEDVNNYLRSWKVPENRWTLSKKVTFRRLLSHQSGLVDPVDSFGPLELNYGVPQMKDLLTGKTPYCSEPVSPIYEPGSDFRYSDASYCIIQLLIEDLTGSPFDQQMQEVIFDPLEMEHSLLFSSHQKDKLDGFASGHNQKGECVSGRYPIYSCPAAAGLWSTPGDLAKMFMELHHGLSGNGKLGISREIIQDMISPQGCSEWTGLGIFLDTTGKEVEISSLGWGIGFQCLLVGFPLTGSCAVVMTNADLGVHQLKGLIGEVIQSIEWGHE